MRGDRGATVAVRKNGISESRFAAREGNHHTYYMIPSISSHRLHDTKHFRHYSNCQAFRRQISSENEGDVGSVARGGQDGAPPEAGSDNDCHDALVALGRRASAHHWQEALRRGTAGARAHKRGEVRERQYQNRGVRTTTSVTREDGVHSRPRNARSPPTTTKLAREPVRSPILRVFTLVRVGRLDALEPKAARVSY